MPSAAVKPENKSTLMGESPIIAALNVVEKKVRNLEKRKGKLDGYREKYNAGETLNEDQKAAVAQYDTVVMNLDFARELLKQFQDINGNAEKLQKKQAKREKLEKQMGDMKRVKEILQLQNMLDQLGPDNVRRDFKEGKRGALVLTEENLNQLDELYKLISPQREEGTCFDTQLNAASEHIVNYLDGKDKEILGTTYKDLKDMTERIIGCGYFDNPHAEEEVVEEEAQDDSSEDSGNSEEYVMAKSDDPQLSEGTETPHTLSQDPVPSQENSIDVTAQHTQPQQTPQEQDPAVVDSSYYASAAEAEAANIQRQRPFNEIVSSVQGNFNFLQESQIDQDSPHMDPAVVAAQPMAPATMSQTIQQNVAESQLPSTASWGDQVAEQSPDSTQQPYFPTDAPQPLPAQGGMVTQQTDPSYASQGYGLMTQNTYQTVEHSQMGHMVDSNTPDRPPAIPLPGQTSMAGDNEHDAQGEKKAFTGMNVSAPVFQSTIYTTVAQGAESTPGQGMDVTTQGSTTNTTDYNSSGGFSPRNNYYGGRGGQSRGRGGPRGMSNGFRGRGAPISNRGSYGGRGGSRGGSSYQGYPPRDNYRPEGGYQGYNGSYNSGFNKRGGMRGNSRGGRGGRGSYGGNKAHYNQQQTQAAA